MKIGKTHCEILLIWYNLLTPPLQSSIPGAVSDYKLWLWDSPAVVMLLAWNLECARADWLRPLEMTPGRCLVGPGATSWSSDWTLGARVALFSPVTLCCQFILLSVLLCYIYMNWAVAIVLAPSSFGPMCPLSVNMPFKCPETCFPLFCSLIFNNVTHSAVDFRSSVFSSTWTWGQGCVTQAKWIQIYLLFLVLSKCVLDGHTVASFWSSVGLFSVWLMVRRTRQFMSW